MYTVHTLQTQEPTYVNIFCFVFYCYRQTFLCDVKDEEMMQFDIYQIITFFFVQIHGYVQIHT